MFTGIIEEIGKIVRIVKNNDVCKIEISAKTILEDIKLGDSIAVNGICLTVTNYNFKSFEADVMNETWKKTAFFKFKIGEYVNLERAMTIGSRFGGHIVSGHIDGIGKIKSIRKDANAFLFQITTSSNILALIVEKGSIAIDGISLTVVNVTNQDFSVSIIPHTIENTILKYKHINDYINLENDMLAKYIRKFINQPKINHQFLIENGF